MSSSVTTSHLPQGQATIGSLVLVLNVLGADGIASEVHDIANRDIGHDVDHPDGVVEGRVVAYVTAVLVEEVWEGVVVLQEVAFRGGVLHEANIVGAVLGVGLLPLPPEAVQVGVVEEEEWVTGAGGLFVIANLVSW